MHKLDRSLCLGAYESSILRRALICAAKDLSNDDFSKYLSDSLMALVPDLKIDRVSMTVRFRDTGGELQRVVEIGQNGMRPDSLKLYMRVKHLDAVGHICDACPGSLIFNTDLLSLASWRDTELHRSFRDPVGANHVFMIRYPLPFKESFQLRFVFQTEYPAIFPENLNRELVEYLCIPFFFCMMYRLDLCDDAALNRWIEMLQGLSVEDVSLIRSVCGARNQVLACRSPKLNLSEPELNSISESILDRYFLANTALDGGFALPNPFIKLMREFSHFSFLGEMLDHREIDCVVAQQLPSLAGGIYSRNA